MIPVNEPLFISDEKKYLAKCIDSGWVSSEGPFVKEFENKFSSYIGRKYGVAVSSGTSALDVAMATIKIGQGDEVIVPTFTIFSCAEAVVARGGIPVFVDSEPETWNIDVNKIEAKISKHTKAILVVHMYGHPSDMDQIMRIARKHKLLVVEDAAEAHGAEYKGRKCGTFGDISCFSFYANKVITTGEGGMLLMDNKKYKERAEILRNLGFVGYKRYYHKEIARNDRMSNIQAALGIAQLRNIKKLIAKKRRVAALYTSALKNIPDIQIPTEKPWAKNIYWMYGVVLSKKSGYTGKSFQQALKKHGIGTRAFFYPLHLQPVWKKVRAKTTGKYPVAERISRQGLYLPSGLGTSEKDIKYVCATIKKLLAEGQTGVVHVANEGVASRYDLAHYMAKQIKPSIKVKKVDRSFFTSAANLPTNEATVSERCTLRPWEEALEDYIEDEWKLYLQSAKIIK